MKINIRNQIEEVEQKIEKLKFQLNVEQAVLTRLKSLGGKKRKGSRRKSSAPRTGSLAAYLQLVLQEAGCALSVQQLVERVKEKGFTSTANVSLNNLVPSAMARRPDIFIRVSHGVYDLKSRAKENPIE